MVPSPEPLDAPLVSPLDEVAFGCLVAARAEAMGIEAMQMAELAWRREGADPLAKLCAAAMATNRRQAALLAEAHTWLKRMAPLEPQLRRLLGEPEAAA
jgi:hypothetical protein